MRYLTQSRSLWNIQHRANLKKKYSRLNEILIGKLQLPSSAFSTNTLGMGQLTHSKTGLHNLNNDLFEITDLSQFSYSLLSILPQGVRGESFTRNLLLWSFSNQKANSPAFSVRYIFQIILYTCSFAKNSSKIVLHICTIFSIAQIHIDFLCIFLSSCPSIYKRRDNFFLGCRLEEIFPGMTNYSRLWYSHFFINTCLSQRKWKWILL